MKGYDTSRIWGMSPNEMSEFSCGICLGIFNEPVVTPCCRQTYCKECIDVWLTSTSTCPNDRKSLNNNDLLPVPRFVNNLLMNIKIRCEYEENGCKVIVKISELGNHTRTCVFGKCPTCGLKKSNAGVHDCVAELIIRNKSISDELDRLSNEMAAPHIFEKARNALETYNIEASKNVTSMQTHILVDHCKTAIVQCDTHADLSRNLYEKANSSFLLKTNKTWMAIAFTENGGESLVESEKYFRIKFNQLIIELFTARR